jgi:acetoin utilization deacetylase AcuC-like enzyme
MRVFYSDKMLADAGASFSPSAMKPKLLAELLLREQFPIQFEEPAPVSVADFKRVHNPTFVDSVLNLKQQNGFENYSASVAASLPWTSGALLAAARAALTDGVSAALCSGFHHAGYAFTGGFCTFNGLMVTAAKLLDEGAVTSVLILDCDMHYGNGTDDILSTLDLPTVRHETFGAHFSTRKQEKDYLQYLHEIRLELEQNPVSLVLYQAGADAHEADPLGGVLSTEGYRAREKLVFEMTKTLGIPIAWNLAGGYQRDAAGQPAPVLDLHRITFEECLRAYSL